MRGKTVTLKTETSSNGLLPINPLPSFSLSEKEYPQMKGWRVGQKYTLEIEVENVGMNKDEYMEKQPLSTRLRILKITEVEVNEEELMAKKGNY